MDPEHGASHLQRGGSKQSRPRYDSDTLADRHCGVPGNAVSLTILVQLLTEQLYKLKGVEMR